jgi:hypothetical protein
MSIVLLILETIMVTVPGFATSVFLCGTPAGRNAHKHHYAGGDDVHLDRKQSQAQAAHIDLQGQGKDEDVAALRAVVKKAVAAF